MNKNLFSLTALLLGVMAWPAAAQDDDLYFVPTKKNVALDDAMYGLPSGTVYSGSSRSVDDYNRRMLSAASDSDIIDFSAVRGVYPDSASMTDGDTDYRLTRQMSRFDDYTPDRAYWDGYRAGRWSSPWYSTWYDWYDPWYDSPWYYRDFYGWHSPYWYHSSWYSPWHYGWYSPYWGYYGGFYGGGFRYYGGSSGRNWSRTGVTHHKTQSGRRTTNLGGYRSSSRGSYRSSGSYEQQSGSSHTGYENRSLGGTRSGSSSSFGNSGGSYGGSRGSGGGRSVGGGRSYGGRR